MRHYGRKPERHRLKGVRICERYGIKPDYVLSLDVYLTKVVFHTYREDRNLPTFDVVRRRKVFR